MNNVNSHNVLSSSCIADELSNAFKRLDIENEEIKNVE